ncbi:S8 family serine peptidase [Streptomyces sp. p1417]|uniref:S8 family serine peptidase n=1 Tax=Streptomyces typhae TaxID=2681492 RepID=A0A6L6WS23_9ACTN|nr:S8 family serine peptidase [Streptomyces typhae]MVO84487.1 S8 family serine peptidase [Streptomyces typhae]
MLMTLDARAPEPGARRSDRARRTARLATAIGVAAALTAAAPLPLAFAADTPSPAPVAPAPKDAAAKLGAADAELLADAKADGEKTVTMMVATAPGATEQVARQLDAVKGGSVGRTYDKLGYVRAAVPTARADAAIEAATKLPSVHAIDLRHEIELDDPRPGSGKGAKGAAGRAAYPAPGKNTPAVNPYNPSFETGAVDFVKKNPKADGRGVTIGVLDSGVDLGHPALQKTTTGERKITDWVTATDPIVDADGTWRRMTNPVSGPTFTFDGDTWKAPAGSYQISRFRENATTGGDAKGDLNRDGDTTDSWGVLYDPAAGTVRVDLNDNKDFGDDKPMKPYGKNHQVGYFGKDDPATDVAERVPFVVEIRKDVPTDPYGGDWVGKKADFVNIGVIESEHGTHVAGITAANKLFGGKMNGAAPGAKLVSSRACTWTGGCTNVALTEGMIDLVTKRGVDIVNMSIGGLPALNDGNNARAELYKRLIDTYGVQLVISAGNSGPGANTIGDPGLADHVISVGASVSKETWAANYGSEVKKKYGMFGFSSRGPREDGGFQPLISAPGSAINTTQTWLPGSPVAEAGYKLPAGYSMLQGTSMASPQAAGAAALLLSAAKQHRVDLTPARLRTALTSTAQRIPGVQAYEQGTGLIDIVDAWSAVKGGAKAHEYTVKAPVDTALEQELKKPGTGLYDREGGLKAGQKKTYEVTITRTTGSSRPLRHKLAFVNNHDKTFKLLGDAADGEVFLPLDRPVKVKVQAAPKSSGVSSAALTVDDKRTRGVDHQIMTTVVVAKDLAKPSFTYKASGSVQRNSNKSYFVNVPKGAKSLEVALGGLKDKSQTRFISIHPYGLPAESTSSLVCYANFPNPDNTCRPDARSYANPTPGVWEIEVEARRTSPVLDNPYKLEVSALGVTFAPAPLKVAEAKAGSSTPVTWKAKNDYAAVDGRLKGGSLGSAATSRPTIEQGETQTTTVVVPEGAERLDAAIGSTADSRADLDLALYKDGQLVVQSADGDSEESVSLAKPAPGTYTLQVAGYSIPSGQTAYDYRDVFFSASLGQVEVDESKVVKLANGATADVSAELVVGAPGAAGRVLFGEVNLLNARGTVAGTGSVTLEKVTE